MRGSSGCLNGQDQCPTPNECSASRSSPDVHLFEATRRSCLKSQRLPNFRGFGLNRNISRQNRRAVQCWGVFDPWADLRSSPGVLHNNACSLPSVRAVCAAGAGVAAGLSAPSEWGSALPMSPAAALPAVSEPVSAPPSARRVELRTDRSHLGLRCFYRLFMLLWVALSISQPSLPLLRAASPHSPTLPRALDFAIIHLHCLGTMLLVDHLSAA